MDDGAGIDELFGGRAVDLINADGPGPFVLACEHASNCIPAAFANLGLTQAELESHIAWDPGALDLARMMSGLLDSPLIASRISRLVYDCNRKPGAAGATAQESDGVRIPGNAGINADEVAMRRAHVYQPFHEAIDECINAREARGQDSVLVTVHSFTPVHGGTRRELELGVLHDADSRLADALLEIAAEDGALDVRRNAPYAPEDGVTHTLIAHGVSRGLDNVMLEIRNDLLDEPSGRKAMAMRLSGWLKQAIAGLSFRAGGAQASGAGAG